MSTEVGFPAQDAPFECGQDAIGRGHRVWAAALTVSKEAYGPLTIAGTAVCDRCMGE